MSFAQQRGDEGVYHKVRDLICVNQVGSEVLSEKLCDYFS